MADDFTQLLAQADQRIAHFDTMIDGTILPLTRHLLAKHEPTAAWALLAEHLEQAMSSQPDVVLEALARLAIRYETRTG